MAPAVPPLRRLRASLLLCAVAVLSCASPAAAQGPVPCTADSAAVSCANGGVCLVNEAVGTYCHCPPGLLGTLCDQTTSDPSLSVCAAGLLVNYCTNGGTCPTTNSSFCNCNTVAVGAGGSTFRCARTRFGSHARPHARAPDPEPLPDPTD
jgi:hypothetical protein